MTETQTGNQLTGQAPGGRTSDRTTFIDTPGFSGSYNAATGYRMADAANSAVFGPAQLVSDTTAELVHPTVLFSNVSSSASDHLALYKHLATFSTILGSGPVAPRYGGTGGWQHSVGANPRRTRLDYFAFGPATPVAAMPRTGVVKYSLFSQGNYAGETDLYFTFGLSEIAVDFAAGTVSGRIGQSGTNFYTGGFGGLYLVTLNGSIVGNGVTGPTGSTIAVASGQFRLLFIGPNADELIITHVGQDGRGTFVGSSVGVRNPYLQ